MTSELGANWTLESYRHAVTLGFAALPYQNLKGIEIEIQAPDPTNLGQLIYLWTKVRGLVALFSHAKELPKISIHLKDTEDTKWAVNGNLQKSIVYAAAIDFDFDYEIVLFPFCRLRNCQEVKIHVPEEVKTNIETPLEFFESVMILKEPFGTYLDVEGDGAWSDEETLRTIDARFFQNRARLRTRRAPWIDSGYDASRAF